MPMIHETLSFFFTLVVLGLIGFGPALWLLAPGEKRASHSLGVAPVLGLAFFILLSFPLVVYVAPAERWALPVTVLLLILSAALTFVYFRKLRVDRNIISRWFRTAIAPLSFLLVLVFLLALPLLTRGIQYTIFRSDPSDAFWYMSLSEMVRTADWHTIQAGAEPSPANVVGMGELARVSPSAMLTARFTRGFAQLNTIGSLAWFAQLSGLPLYRAYYPFYLLLLTSAALVALVLADILKVSPILKYLGAAAVALGFWARFLIETDALGEASAVPIALLFVFACIQLEQQRLRLLVPARMLMALTFAALLSCYSPMAILVAAAIVLYYVLALVTRRVGIRAIALHGGTALAVLLILLFTGQLENVIRILRFLVFSSVPTVASSEPWSLEVIKKDLLAGFWGLPRTLMFDPSPTLGNTLLRRLTDLLAVAVTIAFLVGVVQSLRKTAGAAKPIIFAMTTSAILIAAVMYLRDNERTAGKALQFAYPYFILAALIPTAQLATARNVWLHRAVLAVLALWLAVQVAWGSYLSFDPTPQGFFKQSQLSKQETFDVSAIESVLQVAPPRLLLVNVPRESNWAFAYYTIFVFQRYPSYFQSGIVMDNSTKAQNLWLSKMDGLPDYALMLRATDYLRGVEGATVVAETPDLILYRVSITDPSVFERQEDQMRVDNAQKPFLSPPPLE